MKKNSFLILIFIIILMLGISCKDKKVNTNQALPGTDAQLYNQGMTYIKKDPEKARLYFQQIIDSFAKSIYAQRAKLAKADSYFEAGDLTSMDLAAMEYSEFLSRFPVSPSAPYAQYKIGMSYFKKKLKPGKDQTKTKQALVELQKVLTKFPSSEEAKITREKILICQEYLAEHILGIAKHYFNIKSYKAAISRLNDILAEYLEFSKMEQVYYYIGASHFYMGNNVECLPFLTKLITDYPQSKLIKKTQKIMNKIRKGKTIKK